MFPRNPRYGLLAELGVAVMGRHKVEVGADGHDSSGIDLVMRVCKEIEKQSKESAERKVWMRRCMTGDHSQ